MTKKKILIATGGTGGHVFPALSLANYLIKKNLSVTVTTDTRGFKFLKNYKNLDLVKISSSPIIRKTFLKFLISLIRILISIVKSFLFLLINRPSIIFGMGGYSSFPICLAAAILRIRFVIYENNLIVGKANKYLLTFTNKLFVSYKELEGIPTKYSNKINEIGNILREEIIKFNSTKQVKEINNMNILVLGGSQGAKVFAEKLPQIFEKLNSDDIPIKVYQQCQKDQSEQLTKFYKKAKIDSEIFHFTDNITEYYARASLAVTRSGASVLGELVNLKIPFISIPLPSSADNHQHKNAEFYLKKGYGYLIEEKDINKELYDLLKLIFEDKNLTNNIISKQSQHSDKNVLDSLYTRLEKILDEKN